MKCTIILLVLTSALAVPVEDELSEEFVSGNHRFTAGIYKELLKTETGNFIVSPFSAETILALTNEGAKGQTSQELITGLSLPSSKEKIQQAFKSFLPKLKTSRENLKLLSANKIYAGEGVKLENEFKSVATSVYDSGVDTVNFTKNVEAANTINKWVDDNTNSKIQNLIDPTAIDESTRLVLVNALYFSGEWVNQFTDYQTAKKKFYRTKDNTVEVDTMHQIDYFNYYENKKLNARFLELPYRGADISMVIVLPNEVDGLARLEANVEQLFAPQPFTNERVDIDLPKFTIETKIDFIPILQQLGINKIFTTGADLTGISSTDKNLLVSDVVQKAFINVTEQGTEAAAATAVIVAVKSDIAQITPPPPVPFKADHPFLYYITCRGVHLFAGRVAEFK